MAAGEISLEQALGQAPRGEVPLEQVVKLPGAPPKTGGSGKGEISLEEAIGGAPKPSANETFDESIRAESKPGTIALRAGEDVGKNVLGSAAGLMDMFTGLLGMAVGTGAYMGTRATAAGAGESNRLGAQAAAVSAEHFTPEALATPFRKVMKHLGYADVYDSSSVGEAMQWISKRIESGSQSLSRETKGVVQPEDVQALATAAMLYFGVRGTSAALRSASHSRENVRWDKAAKTSDAQKFQDLVKPLDEQQAAAHPAAEVAKTTEAAFDHSKDFKDWLKVDEPAAPKAASSGIAVEEGYRPKTTSGPGAFQIGTSEAEKPGVRPDTPDPYEGLPGGTAPQGWTGVVSKETLLREAGDPTADLHPKADKSLATDTIEGDPKERGSIDLKLLTRMALLGTGAVAGAYLDKDNPVIGAIIGGIGGAIATRAGRAALDRWKASPAEGRAATWLSNKLYTLTKQSQVRQLQALAFLQKVVPPDYKFHAESIYHSMEDSKVKLSARARELKDALVRPLQAANAKLRSSLEALGVNVGPAIEQDYVHRIVKGQRSSVFEELEKSYPSGRNLPKTAPSLKEREAYAIETPTGNREVITMEPGNKFFVHRNGKIVGRGSMKGGEIKWGGQDWKRVQATTGEIEAHTNLRYYKDAVGTELDNNIRLSAALRNAEFLNKLKSMPSFSDVAVNVKDTHAPADWRTVDIDQLKGYKFAPRVASALDDFKGEMAKHPAEALGKISRILTGSMFWNPLPHIWNVLDHAIVQRGLSAWVSPQGYTRLWKTVGPAWKAVVTQDSNYLKFMHEGAGLMYPNVILRDFSEKVMQQLGQAPDMGPVARAFGYANPAEMVRRIYALSRKTLWAGNDVIMMQAYFEKQLQGASVQGAIRQVEKHIPNYRIPDRVLGSRTISQVLQSPFFTAFGRYDYGRLASYGAMIKDAVGKNSSVGARAKALDQMSMLAVMGLVVYPIVLDKVAQAITGDPKAKAGRFGASTVPYLLYEYFHQRQDLNQVVRSSMPIGPMLNASLEVYTNRDTFTGGKLFKSGQDAFSFISKQVSPLYTATRVQQGKVTPKEAAWQAVGVRFPKSAEDLKRARQQKALDKAIRGGLTGARG